MRISLLNDCMRVDVFYEKTDSEFDDNICLSFTEPCPDDEKVFNANESNIYLTTREARQLAQALLAAAEESDIRSRDD